METFKDLSFSDENMAERFQMLEELFLIRSLVLYFN
jgi:hypothetical protein